MKIALLVTGLCLLAFERLLIMVHHGPAWMGFTGFYGIFGGLVCVALIFGGKCLGRVGLQKRPDYYET